MTRALFFVLALLSLIWGGSYYFIKILLIDFGPWTIAFLRSTLGLVTITIIMIALNKPFGLKKISWIPMIIMALINTAIPWALIGFSETRISSSMASILNATTPLWTLILGILFFKKRATLFQWLGMIVAMIGLITLLDINPVTFISVDIIGFTSMTIASLFYAIGAHLSKRLSQSHTMYQITFCTLLSCMLGSGTIAISFEHINFIKLLSLPNSIAIIGLGMLGSGIAYILFYLLIQKGGPEIATLVTYLIPVSGIIWGSVLLNEIIKWSLLAGLVLILGGVFLINMKTSQRKIIRSDIKNYH